ncbi:MAG: hypothetical protein GC182_09765 [Rhodopseudomonas sp.]|nr:hypothetical protein [Rhodopseudomonas sp.]
MALCLVISMAGIAASLGASQKLPDASQGNSIIAVFPPWWSASRSLLAASEAGAVLDSGAYSFVVVVKSQGPDFVGRLRAAGAVLLLDPLGLGGCFQKALRNENV